MSIVPALALFSPLADTRSSALRLLLFVPIQTVLLLVSVPPIVTCEPPLAKPSSTNRPACCVPAAMVKPVLGLVVMLTPFCTVRELFLSSVPSVARALLVVGLPALAMRAFVPLSVTLPAAVGVPIDEIVPLS